MKKWAFLLVSMSFFAACNHGVEKAYWENGNLKSELRYVDGKLNGECVWYFTNGQKSLQAIYKDDVLEGHLMRWHANGQIESDC